MESKQSTRAIQFEDEELDPCQGTRKKPDAGEPSPSEPSSHVVTETAPEGDVVPPESSRPSGMKMVNSIDSPHLRGPVFLMAYYLWQQVFSRVEGHEYQDYQRRNECGYIAIHGAYQLKKTDLGWTPVKVLDGDHEDIITLHNMFIDQKPLHEPIALCSEQIGRIIINLEFLENNFEVDTTTYPRPAQNIYLTIIGLSWMFGSKELRESDLMEHIDFLVHLAKPGLFFDKLSAIKTLLKLSVRDFDRLDKFFREGIEPLLLPPRCPNWFAGVFSASKFREHAINSAASNRLDDIKRIAIVNTMDEPGEHWYTVCYILPELTLSKDLVKAS